MSSSISYEEKYIKYKIKYLKLSNQLANKQMIGGSKKLKRKIHRKNKSTNLTNSNNLMEAKYYKNENLSEPWFTLISLGLKTVEGRKNKGKW